MNALREVGTRVEISHRRQAKVDGEPDMMQESLRQYIYTDQAQGTELSNTLYDAMKYNTQKTSVSKRIANLHLAFNLYSSTSFLYKI